MRWPGQFFSRRRIYDDLSEEIRLHLEEKMEALIADGISREDAEHAARREFGNAAVMEERGREAWQWPLLESLWADMKFALRQLAKAPGFSVTVIVTIALGVGANAAIFNLMRAVVFPSLPVPQPGQLFLLRSISTPNDAAWLYSGPAFDRLRAAAPDIAQVAAHTSIAQCSLTERNGENSERARMQLVSENFFSTLQLIPMRGRVLLDGDALPVGGAWAAVLRYGYWRQHFAADPSVIGRTVAINGTPVTIVGITPERFLGVVPGEVPDFWLPIEAQKSVRYAVPFDSLGYGSGVDLNAPYRHQEPLFWLSLIARVAPGKEAAAPSALTHAFQPDLALYARFTSEDRRAAVLASTFTLHPLARSEGTMFGRYARPLIVLMAMVAAVLLIACVNLANLQSTRLLSRQREFVMRSSLGASRARILQQILVESSILTVIGGGLALLLAIVSGPILLRWASQGPEVIPLDLHFSAEVYGFVFVLLMLAIFAFAFLPAWRVVRIDLVVALRGHAIAQSSRRTLSNILLSSQVALSLLLLVLASMFMRTLVNLNHVDTGFDRQHILVARFAFHGAGYKAEKVQALAPQMLERLQTLPGVRSAALDMCALPGCLWNSVIHVAGHPELSEGVMQAHQDNVGSGYFHTLGIPVLQGREFNDGDRRETQQVAMVNRALATKLFGSRDPIGQKVGFGPPPADAQFVIVGVVGDVRVDDLRSPAPPVFYRPFAQDSIFVGGIEMRTDGDPLLIANEVHRALFTLDPRMPVTEINSITADYDRTLTTEYLLVRLTSIFGGLALALAAIGLYGVLSFRVARSTSELGVRVALGATRTNILRLVMGQAAVVFVLGAIPGALFAAIIGRAIHGLLFGVSGMDWLSIFLSTGVLGMTGAVAAFLPARRAASIDPMQALRTE
jgi:putative ABC transport system permease protein